MSFKTFNRLSNVRKQAERVRESVSNLVDETEKGLREFAGKKAVIKKDGKVVAEIPVAVGLPVLAVGFVATPLLAVLGTGVAISQSYSLGLGEKSELDDQMRVAKPRRAQARRRR